MVKYETTIKIRARERVPDLRTILENLFYRKPELSKKAEKLVYLTDVQGLYRDLNDESSLVSVIDATELDALVATGTLREGMIPKIAACLSAVRNGVERAHILDGRIPHAILLEFFTREGVGTMVTP